MYEQNLNTAPARSEDGLTHIADNIHERLATAATRLARITGQLLGSAPTPIAGQGVEKPPQKYPLNIVLDRSRSWLQQIEGDIQRLESSL